MMLKIQPAVNSLLKYLETVLVICEVVCYQNPFDQKFILGEQLPMQFAENVPASIHSVVERTLEFAELIGSNGHFWSGLFITVHHHALHVRKPEHTDFIIGFAAHPLEETI